MRQLIVYHVSLVQCTFRAETIMAYVNRARTPLTLVFPFDRIYTTCLVGDVLTVEAVRGVFVLFVSYLLSQFLVDTAKEVPCSHCYSLLSYLHF